jgi:hypothetical protein
MDDEGDFHISELTGAKPGFVTVACKLPFGVHLHVGDRHQRVNGSQYAFGHASKARCTTGSERRITRWEHEHVLEAVQQRLDKNPQAMRVRRETAEHPFATLKMRMGATHFLMKTLPRVATEMALHVLAYKLTRVMNILGIQPLMAAMRAYSPR